MKVIIKISDNAGTGVVRRSTDTFFTRTDLNALVLEAAKQIPGYGNALEAREDETDTA